MGKQRNRKGKRQKKRNEKEEKKRSTCRRKKKKKGKRKGRRRKEHRNEREGMGTYAPERTSPFTIPGKKDMGEKKLNTNQEK